MKINNVVSNYGDAVYPKGYFGNSIHLSKPNNDFDYVNSKKIKSKI